MVDGKKQLNTKIPQDLWDKLEETDTPKQNIVADALRQYLDSQNKPEDSQNKPEDRQGYLEDSQRYQQAIFEIAALKTKLESNEDIIKVLKDQVNDLQKQNGFLISEFQRINTMNERLLLTEAEEHVKKRWKFWKK